MDIVVDGSVIFVPQAAIKEQDDPEKDRPCVEPCAKANFATPPNF